MSLRLCLQTSHVSASVSMNITCVCVCAYEHHVCLRLCVSVTARSSPRQRQYLHNIGVLGSGKGGQQSNLSGGVDVGRPVGIRGLQNNGNTCFFNSGTDSPHERVRLSAPCCGGWHGRGKLSSWCKTLWHVSVLAVHQEACVCACACTAHLGTASSMRVRSSVNRFFDTCAICVFLCVCCVHARTCGTPVMQVLGQTLPLVQYFVGDTVWEIPLGVLEEEDSHSPVLKVQTKDLEQSAPILQQMRQFFRWVLCWCLSMCISPLI